MNGDITLEALRRCQRASKVISLFIIFAVFDVCKRNSRLLNLGEMSCFNQHNAVQ